MSETVQEAIKQKIAKRSIIQNPEECIAYLRCNCCVYTCYEGYLAKRFDSIHYQYCTTSTATQILTDNLQALLKYDPILSTPDKEYKKIVKEIIREFVENPRTSLINVEIDPTSDTDSVVNFKSCPDGCIAFKNGVYNFRTNDWLFKYEYIEIPEINNKIIKYDREYLITWYLNYNFEPLNINMKNVSFDEFLESIKQISDKENALSFKLAYNMCHDNQHEFSSKKMIQLCQILGYTLLQSFSQYFVFFIGSGQNGKNSLFDGCFTNRLMPRAAANSLDDIENDRFITGALENHSHNIFLETSAKTYTESKMIKALTGSEFQTIESKGIDKRSGIINCKYIFAGNDRETIRFADSTMGFRRRMQFFDVTYQWDKRKTFLKKGDYYDTSFSDDLHEIKQNIINTSLYVYMGIYGIISGTENFTRSFKFTYNEWANDYFEGNQDMKDLFMDLTVDRLISAAANSQVYRKTAFMDADCKALLHVSDEMKTIGCTSVDDLYDILQDPEIRSSIFSEYDHCVLMETVKKAIGAPGLTGSSFTPLFKKAYPSCNISRGYGNKGYVRFRVDGDKVMFV